MTDFCPDLAGDPAVLLTLDAHDRFTELATRSYELAVQNLNAFNDIHLRPIEFTVDFNFDGQLAGFQRPPRPNISEAAFEFRDPGGVGTAPVFDAQSVSLDPAPTFDEAKPNLVYGPRPSTPDIPTPVAPSTPPRPIIPEAPDFERYIPDEVTLQSLNLPTLDVINLPTFDAERPVFIEPPINENWTFDPQPYVSTMLPALQAEILRMLQGQAALPASIERVIFDRGRSRIEREVQRTVEQTFDEFASRGFSEPPGMLAGRLIEIRQGGQDRIGELNRDLTIKAFEEALANLRLALAQGAALEGVTINLHIEEQRFALEAARFTRETAIAILNARVTVFNARMQGYQIDAQVLETRIRAELAKLEIYRAKIEAERLRGEINEQSVRIYAEQWRAVQILADFHRTRIEGVKIEAEANRIPIDIYRAQIDAFGERWRAHVAEWQGYQASIDGEGKKADVYKTLGDVFGERTRSWSVGQNLKFDNEKLRLAQHGQVLDVYRAGLARQDSLLATERTRLTAVGQAAESQARIYAAGAEVEKAASAAIDRTFQLGLERAKALVDTQLETARILIQQNAQLLEQAISIGSTKTQVSGQLAASTMSAMSYSASVGSTRSKSQSCSQNFSFDGEIADASI